MANLRLMKLAHRGKYPSFSLLHVPVHFILFEDTGPHIIIIGYTLGRKTLLSANANA
jgi:hypothetical protein